MCSILADVQTTVTKRVAATLAIHECITIQLQAKNNGGRGAGFLYAESEDGIKWCVSYNKTKHLRSKRPKVEVEQVFFSFMDGGRVLQSTPFLLHRLYPLASSRYTPFTASSRYTPFTRIESVYTIHSH